MLYPDKEKNEQLFMRYLNQSDKGERSFRQKTKEYAHLNTTQGKMYGNVVAIGDIQCILLLPLQFSVVSAFAIRRCRLDDRFSEHDTSC